MACLQKAIAEAERLCGDLRADRGVMDIVDADGQTVEQAPALIAIVSDNGSCFRVSARHRAGWRRDHRDTGQPNDQHNQKTRQQVHVYT